jgi:hypothetical protein
MFNRAWTLPSASSTGCQENCPTHGSGVAVDTSVGGIGVAVASGDSGAAMLVAISAEVAPGVCVGSGAPWRAIAAALATSNVARASAVAVRRAAICASLVACADV